ncbi:hypothetical protein LTR56_009735 [Elasticomyces elasticus]|nr:hypothetical protein LTR56_009735 [Elasticomyces elasticus]KAK3653540.1 hypothetical protein LTR22_011214 [Elasticomyces elasticus]KAK4919155.1 hypothetical protein LTR49_013159 [Elasticomyces elasticus]KAK5753191.1 hypothetical protein LTS12_016762 [Elasticomyces elasticus]
MEHAENIHHLGQVVGRTGADGTLEIPLCGMCIAVHGATTLTAETTPADGPIKKTLISKDNFVQVDEANCTNDSCVAAAAGAAVTEALDNGTFELPVSKRCYHWLKKSHEHHKAMGKATPATQAFIDNLRIVDSEEECMNPHCSEVSEPAAPVYGHLAHPGSRSAHSRRDGLPISRRCYHLMKESMRCFISERLDPDPSKFDGFWAIMSDKLRIQDHEFGCTFPGCPDQQLPATHDTSSDMHSHDTDIDTSVCDCTCARASAVHTEILGYIDQLEQLFAELTVARNVTHTLREQTGPVKKVDMAMPPGSSRGELKTLSRMVMDLDLDGDK